MLRYDTAMIFFEDIREKAEKCTQEGFDFLYKKFLEKATEYAQTRTAWAFMNPNEQMEDDSARSTKHDAFMKLLTAMCRNLGIENLEEIMPDRKTKGDFACYITLFLALEQR